MILKTVNSDGNMFDLLVNIIKNLTFYLTHRSELADIGYSDKDLYGYKDKLLSVVQMYEDETIPQWFKDFPINTFLSSKFPYKTPTVKVGVFFENKKTTNVVYFQMVELRGFEPLTSSVQARRSSQLS